MSVDPMEFSGVHLRVQEAFTILREYYASRGAVQTCEKIEKGRFVSSVSFGVFKFEQSEPVAGDGLSITRYTVRDNDMFQLVTTNNETQTFYFDAARLHYMELHALNESGAMYEGRDEREMVTSGNN